MSAVDSRISIIIVTYNSEERIISCLKALNDEMDAIGGKILLFDNNSTDATVRIVETKFPHIKIFQSSKNIGFAAGANSAVAKANGEYILFANPDMIIDRGALMVLLEAIKRQPDAGAVVARMRNADGSFQPTCRRLPDYRNILFSRGSALPINSLTETSGNKYTLGDFKSIAEVPAASATCMLIRKDFFQSIGGLDNRFFMFMEDTDLCLRIGQAGKKVYFAPQAGAVHYWGTGAAVSNIKRKRYHHISVWKYFIKHYPNGFSIFILPLALLFNFLLSIFSGLDKHMKRSG